MITIGKTEGHLGSSLYLREVLGREEGTPPSVDLTAECEHGNFVRKLIHTGRLSACHDISDGGLLVALTKMSFTKNIGATVTFPSALPAQAFAFGEDQGRYLLVAPAEHAQNILEEALVAKVPALMLGKTGGDAMNVEGLMSEKIESLRKVNESWLPDYMAG